MWVCHPLQSAKMINDRLDAVDDLYSVPEATAEAKCRMRKLPDLERIIARFSDS